jgi:DNA invertase Pin-like site-specific DNA recombinase
MSGKTVGYRRVSSSGQNPERQLSDISLDKVYTEYASARNKRPVLSECLDYLRDGDTWVIHSMDRAFRNTEEALSTIRELKGRGVSINFVKENLKIEAGTNNAFTDLYLTVLSSVACFENQLIKERREEGVRIYRLKHPNKPWGAKPKLNPEQVESLKKKAASGISKSALSKEFGISRQSVYTYLKK